MAVFEYSAIEIDASPAGGTVVADTPRQARDILRERGLSVRRVRLLPDRARATFASRRRGHRAGNEVVAFIRELATLLGAGIPLLGALQTLAVQHKGHFRAVIQHLGDQVSGGTFLAEAMGRHPDYFDELCLGIVGVGESTGALDASLAKLAEFKESNQRLRSKVTTALVYPLAVCTVGVAVAIFLMTYVVPNLLEALVQAGKDLPRITRIVKAGSDLMVRWWWAIIACALAGAAGVLAGLRTEAGKTMFDRAVLRIPLIGDLIRKETTSRMAVILAALLRSGLPFVRAVEITRRTLRNRVFARALDDYAAAVAAGADLAGPLRAGGVFSPMVVQMLAVGQQSGRLEDMLEQLARSYQQQVDTATQRLTSLIEPALIVLLAILVGFIAFATILPILEVSNVL